MKTKKIRLVFVITSEGFRKRGRGAGGRGAKDKKYGEEEQGEQGEEEEEQREQYEEDCRKKTKSPKDHIIIVKIIIHGMNR